jgi:multidrug efflux pump subunit AcrB
VAREAERVIRQVAAEYGTTTADKHKPRKIIDAMLTSVGGGAPRWWYTITPELQQQNYAQIILRLRDKDDTPALAPLLQRRLSEQIPGAWLDVHQLRLNSVPYPVSMRLAGRTTVSSEQEAADIRTLRRLSRELEAILRSSPFSERVRNDWGDESFVVRLDIEPDRANIAGITNADVAAASAAAVNGIQVTSLREGDRQIPVVARMRPGERAQLADLSNLYVYSAKRNTKVPLLGLATLEHGMQTQKIRHLEQFRTVTVFGYPQDGALSSDLFNSIAPQIEAFRNKLPPGYSLEITGDEAHRRNAFSQLLVVMAISAIGIFVALVLQFNNAVKPLIVFAAVPYGMVGGLLALYVTGTPFAFMAFLGLISLIGVIVSHVIVLFDFIETMREKGEPLREALLDAGIVRLRPVLITVSATVLALFPLAVHGGPLWKPLCFAQIGGLTFATFVTLVLVPVIYSTVVLDLGLVKWDGPQRKPPDRSAEPSA